MKVEMRREKMDMYVVVWNYGLLCVNGRNVWNKEDLKKFFDDLLGDGGSVKVGNCEYDVDEDLEVVESDDFFEYMMNSEGEKYVFDERFVEMGDDWMVMRIDKLNLDG